MHGGTPLPLALNMPVSAVSDFFTTGAYSNYCKAQEGQQKLILAVLSRIDNVVRAVGGLGKALVGRR